MLISISTLIHISRSEFCILTLQKILILIYQVQIIFQWLIVLNWGSFASIIY